MYLNKFDIDTIELAGCFDYLGNNEVYLDDTTSFLGSEVSISNKSCKTSQLRNYGQDGTDRHFIVEGVVVNCEYKHEYRYFLRDRLDRYSSQHVLVVEISNAKTIAHIKSNLSKMVYNLGQMAQYATTCVFNSQALDSSEKKLFAVENKNAIFVTLDVSQLLIS